MPQDKSDSISANKTLWTFSIASFLHDAGADMVFSVWPIYVQSVLGANMAALGFIDGLGDAVVSLSQAFGGYLSDRFRKRKVFVMLGYAFGGIARIGYALSRTWLHLVPFRILDRSGKMRTMPRDAIIAEESRHGHRGKRFGLLRLMDNLGAVTGVVLAMSLLGVLGYRLLFLVAAIPSFLAVLLVAVCIPEKRNHRKALANGMRLRDIDGRFRVFLVASAFFSLGTFSYSFLLIAANAAGFPVMTVPLLYLMYTFIAGIASMPFGQLSDRIGRKATMLIAYGCWALTAVVFIVSSHPIAVLFAFVLYGLHCGAFDTVQRAFVSELAPPQFMASAMGVFQMVIGLVSLPASLIAGLLWDKVGPHAPFYLALMLTAIAAVALLCVREKRQRSS